MPEDASLDDFRSGPASSDGADDGDTGRTSKRDGSRPSVGDGADSPPADRDSEEAEPRDGDGEDGGDGPDPERVEPVTSTSQSVPDGTACPDCGGPVTRLWRDGDRLVCAGCTTWNTG